MVQTLNKPADATRKRGDGVLPAIVAAGGIAGVLLLSRVYQPLDSNYFYAVALISFFVPFGILAYINRRRAKSHRRPQRLPVWFFLGPLTVAIVILINGALDRYPPMQKIVTVSRKTRSSGGRSGPHYRIEFASWRRPGTERLEVRRDTFDAIHTGDSVAINVHRGALGFTWIGAIRVVPNPDGW